MGSFRWDVDGSIIDIVFSLIQNARAIMGREGGPYEERIIGVRFDYLDHEDIVVDLADLDVDEREYDRDLWNMLLQVSGLETT